MKRCRLTLIVAVFTITSTGCTMLNASRDAMVQSAKMFQPNPNDGSAPMSDDADEWEFVGHEGRADQKRERDPDRWWQNLVMSPEARHIERNLGID